MTDSPRILRLDTAREDAAAALADLRRRLSPQGNFVSEAGRQRTLEVFGEPLTPQQVVQRICNDVRTGGIQAVLSYSEKLDRRPLRADELRVPASELRRAHAAADPQFLAALGRIKARILKFQQALLLRDVRVEQTAGGYLAQRYLPLRRVGVCVPGGAAAYPSTVLMTALPAQAAGVKEIAIIAPPTPFGAYNDDLLATCHELGLTEVYRVGGAQGVAALAYGVEGLPRVDKIVGPGNLFVALAKSFVFGEVDIDSIAGPSEVVVVADDSARPDCIAADLIAQAEHAPGASILITCSRKLCEAVSEALVEQCAKLPRGDLALASLASFGALILAQSDDEAARLANELAPEHLHLVVAQPEAWLAKIPHAGAAFLGNFSPVAVGDYAAGPSHVLPTGGTARWASGLCANDFLRGNSVIALSESDLASIADDVRLLAHKEGLTAHWDSVARRL